MSKTIIIYGSTTGNCESIAETIKNKLISKGLEVTLKNVRDAYVDELIEYDKIILGSSTWGDGELQDDFIDFDRTLEGTNLADKKVAIFGVGNSGWPSFCGSVDVLECSIKATGATLITNSLRIDVDPAPAELEEWTEKVAA